MLQSLSMVCVHAVFSTKNRVGYLKGPDLRDAVWRLVAQTSAEVDCPVLEIGGTPDTPSSPSVPRNWRPSAGTSNTRKHTMRSGISKPSCAPFCENIIWNGMSVTFGSDGNPSGLSGKPLQGRPSGGMPVTRGRSLSRWRVTSPNPGLCSITPSAYQDRRNGGCQCSRPKTPWKLSPSIQYRLRHLGTKACGCAPESGGGRRLSGN